MAELLNTLIRAEADTVVVANQQQTFYVLTLIKRLLPYLPLWEDAQKVTIPDRSGGFGGTQAIQFRRFNSIAVDTTPLTEGKPPDPKTMSTALVGASLQQFGDWIKLSDLLVSTSLDDIMQEAMDLLAENAGRKLHQIILNQVTGSEVTQAVFGGSATTIETVTAADVLSDVTIKKAVRRLRANNVPPFPDGYYRGIISPWQAYDLMGSNTYWTDVAKYNGGLGADGSINMIAGEIGKMHGVRFRESTEMPVQPYGAGGTGTIPARTGGANVYTGVVYGPNSFGVFDLKSQAVQNIDNETGRGMKLFVRPVNDPTTGDPLGQFGFVSWKASFAAKVIDPLRIVRLVSGATQ